jgi:hypothetical protein
MISEGVGASVNEIGDYFAAAGIPVVDINVRSYPDETNFLVFVEDQYVPKAAEIGNQLDDRISSPERRAFVVIRRASPDQIKVKATSQEPLPDGVQDPRATELIHLIRARSRVSEVQPSLSYIPNAEFNLSAVAATRHQLIFGRRGAGKSSLLVEVRRSLRTDETLTCWLNIQTYRNEPSNRVFIYILDELLSQMVARSSELPIGSVVSAIVANLYERSRSLLAQREVDDREAEIMIPEMQRAIRRYIEISGLRFYIFLDDFYYLRRADQPRLLDMLHGCVRDCDAWLKIASIRHLTRWFQSSPPLGLETIHDAEHLNLDITLQNPRRAKDFLESILTQYLNKIGVSALNRLFHGKALDRLVLASGAVPRDYLLLASSAIAKAQGRPNAKLVGAQDVNQAAGDAAQVKLQELEEDMASNIDSAARTLEAFGRVRDFCLNRQNHTYFLVGYNEKESLPDCYNVLTDLLDARLIHLLDAGVSDPHAAGHRFEAYMLDLSQFSGSRLKQSLRVLDYSRGSIVSRQTRERQTSERRNAGSDLRVGDTPLKAIAILRTAPNLPLEIFKDLAGNRQDALADFTSCKQLQARDTKNTT